MADQKPTNQSGEKFEIKTRQFSEAREIGNKSNGSTTDSNNKTSTSSKRSKMTAEKMINKLDKELDDISISNDEAMTGIRKLSTAITNLLDENSTALPEQGVIGKALKINEPDIFNIEGNTKKKQPISELINAQIEESTHRVTLYNHTGVYGKILEVRQNSFMEQNLPILKTSLSFFVDDVINGSYRGDEYNVYQKFKYYKNGAEISKSETIDKLNNLLEPRSYADLMTGVKPWNVLATAMFYTGRKDGYSLVSKSETIDKLNNLLEPRSYADLMTGVKPWNVLATAMFYTGRKDGYSLVRVIPHKEIAKDLYVKYIMKEDKKDQLKKKKFEKKDKARAKDATAVEDINLFLDEYGVEHIAMETDLLTAIPKEILDEIPEQLYTVTTSYYSEDGEDIALESSDYTELNTDESFLEFCERMLSGKAHRIYNLNLKGNRNEVIGGEAFTYEIGGVDSVSGKGIFDEIKKVCALNGLNNRSTNQVAVNEVIGGEAFTYEIGGVDSVSGKGIFDEIKKVCALNGLNNRSTNQVAVESIDRDLNPVDKVNMNNISFEDIYNSGVFTICNNAGIGLESASDAMLLDNIKPDSNVDRMYLKIRKSLEIKMDKIAMEAGSVGWSGSHDNTLDPSFGSMQLGGAPLDRKGSTSANPAYPNAEAMEAGSVGWSGSHDNTLDPSFGSMQLGGAPLDRKGSTSANPAYPNAEERVKEAQARYGRLERMFGSIKGETTEILDNTRVIPIKGGDRLIGAYYIEYTHQDIQHFIGMRTVIGNPIAYTQNIDMLNIRTDEQEETLGRMIFTDTIQPILEKNMDTRFLKDNANILYCLKQLLEENEIGQSLSFQDMTRYNMYNMSRIIFIPGNQLIFGVHGDTGLGVSTFNEALVPANAAILANEAYLSWLLCDGKGMSFVQVPRGMSEIGGENGIDNLKMRMDDIMISRAKLRDVAYNNFPLCHKIILMEKGEEATEDIEIKTLEFPQFQIDQEQINRWIQEATNIIGYNSATFSSIDGTVELAKKLFEIDDTKLLEILKCRRMFKLAFSQLATKYNSATFSSIDGTVELAKKLFEIDDTKLLEILKCRRMFKLAFSQLATKLLQVRGGDTYNDYTVEWIEPPVERNNNVKRSEIAKETQDTVNSYIDIIESAYGSNELWEETKPYVIRELIDRLADKDTILNDMDTIVKDAEGRLKVRTTEEVEEKNSEEEEKNDSNNQNEEPANEEHNNEEEGNEEEEK